MGYSIWGNVSNYNGGSEGMKKVIRLSDVKNDCRLISPADTLRDALHDIENGEKKPNKLMVLMLDDTNGKYDASFYCSNLKASEVIALFEIEKDIFVRMIND